MVRIAVVLALVLPALVASLGVAPPEKLREHALLQTWGQALDGSGAKGTGPIARVVNLLNVMQATLKKEMAEDDELYQKLRCWCENSEYEKTEGISSAESKISELTSTIEQLTARCAELKEAIAQLEATIAADKQTLAEATELREKELKAFHGGELDSIQAIENLKAAIVVLGKHHEGKATMPDLKTEQDSWSFLAVGRESIPWAPGHES